MVISPSPIYDEVYEFLLSKPSLDDIIHFRPSDETKQRVQVLLAAIKKGDATAEQQHELDEFMQVEHFVRMLKLKARQKLD